jgi:predicted nucleic acid-binding protein
MRVLLDTNVLISALITEGKSGLLLKTLFANDHVLVLSFGHRPL